MAERERGQTSAGGGVSGSRNDVIAETPAQRAGDATKVSGLVVSGLEQGVDELEHVTDAAIWSQKRDEAKQAVVEATKSLERARKVATATEVPELDVQAARIEGARRRLDAIATPRAYAEISREADIQAILDAPLVGGAKAGNDKKEADLTALFRGLDVRESRGLSQRLNKKAPGDPIATAIARLTADRRERLQSILAGAPRREMVARDPNRSGRPPRDTEPPPSEPSAPTAKQTDESPVQRKAETASSPAAESSAVHSAAARGTSGSGGALPHVDKIQRSFGRHDVTGVKAHTGSAASEAAGSMGAEAFATGNNVAFAGAPSLHTAAHEAAHVVQQRGGVQLKGGVGQEGDPHERHADHVADTVVAGGSAEPLLDQVAGQRGSTSETVQRSPAAKSDIATDWNRFLAAHHRDLFWTLTDRLEAKGLPPAGAKLIWREGAGRKLGLDVRSHIETRADDYLSKLDILSQPGNLKAQLLALGAPPTNWNEAIGTIIAIAFDTTLRDAVLRMGRQLQIVVDRREHHDLPPASSMVPLYPIDLVVGPFVVSNVTPLGPSHQAVPKDDQAQMYNRGVIEVAYDWVEDPALWNWIRVAGPKNATVEDVARTPFIDGTHDDGEWAYRIAARPPYFGLPVELARRVPKAWKKAPEDVKRAVERGAGQGQVVSTEALDRNGASDPLALAQATGHGADESKQHAPKPGNTTAVDELLGANHVQVELLTTVLERFGAKGPVATASAFLARRDAERGTNKLAAWEPVLRQQQALLRLAADEITELGERDPKGLSAPVREVISAFAHVVGVSHLAADGAAALAEANHQRALLPVAIADERVRGAVAVDLRSPDEASAQAAEATHSGDDSPATPVNSSDLLDRAATMRRGVGKSGAPDPEAASTLELDAAEFPLKAEIRRVRDQLRQIVEQANSVGIKDEWENGLPTVLALPAKGLPKIDKWLETLDGSHTKTADVRRPALTGVATAWGQWLVSSELKAWTEYANDRIKDERLRNLVTSLLKQLGLMVVSGQIASAAVAAIRGAVAASEVLSALREANIVFEGMELLIQTGLQTGLERLDGGTAGKREFEENLLAGALTALALRPFRGLLGQAKGLQKELQTAAQKATHLGVEVALDFGAGAAAGDMAHRLMHNGEATSIRDGWIQQLVGIGVMKFVGARTEEMHKRLMRAVAGQGDPELLALRAAVTNLEQRANKAVPDEALDTMIEHHALVLRELAFYKANGHNAERANLAAHDAATPGAEFAEAPLRLAKLTPLVDGRAYQGRGPDVQRGIAGVKKAFPDATSTFDAATGVWHIDVGGRTFLIYEIGAQRGPAFEPGAGGKHPTTSGEHSNEPNAEPFGPSAPAIGNGRFRAPPGELAGIHKSWAAKKSSNASAIHYDPESGTSHFEVDIDGHRVRLEAKIAPRLDSFASLNSGQNQVIGHALSADVGFEIMRSIARGDVSGLRRTGITGDARAPSDTLIEFGLGQLSDGRIVVIRGEPSAVDWAQLPGIKPIGHTHPLHAANDLQLNEEHVREASLKQLLSPEGAASLDRQLIFPSVEDFVVMAHLEIVGHQVFTGYVVENGRVKKPTANDSSPRLEFTIGKTEQIGTMPDGRRVFHSTIEGKAGRETPISNRDIWIVEEPRSGFLYMSEPPGVIHEPTSNPNPKTEGVRTEGGRKPSKSSEPDGNAKAGGGRTPSAENHAKSSEPDPEAEKERLTIEQEAAASKIPPEGAKNWNAVKDLIDKPLGQTPPDGYQIYKRGRQRFLRRLNVDDALFARLTVDELGNITLSRASNRLAVPGRLAKNLGDRPPDHQAHHLVPDEVVRQHDLFKLAREKASYDIDRKSNGIYLPDSVEAQTETPASKNLPIHSGSHPAYSKIATDFADKELADLKEEYGSVGKIPRGELERAASRVEDKLRNVVITMTRNASTKKMR